jgi:3-phenylpropionate/trans-cinnamate dioxygenase ferredoxin subunit
MEWHRSLPLADVPLAGTVAVTIADEDILLCRVAEEEVFAVANCCSHDDAPLADGHLDDRQIVCARHGARFDLASGAVL